MTGKLCLWIGNITDKSWRKLAALEPCEAGIVNQFESKSKRGLPTLATIRRFEMLNMKANQNRVALRRELDKRFWMLNLKANQNFIPINS